MYIVTNKLTQKQTKIWQTLTNSSSINIKVITTLQIYNIINKHVKLDKSNKDSHVTVHLLSRCRRYLSMAQMCFCTLYVCHQPLAILFFQNFLLTFCFQNNI